MKLKFKQIIHFKMSDNNLENILGLNYDGTIWYLKEEKRDGEIHGYFWKKCPMEIHPDYLSKQ